VRIHVDADGCPVRAEVLRVAARYSIPVCVVANASAATAGTPGVESVVVGPQADAADDWIAENAAANDVVVTTDILLAARCLAKGASVLHPTGRPFTDGDIGSALAMRELLAERRSAGERTRGPAPFRDRDRSQFLQALDAAVQRRRRAR